MKQSSKNYQLIKGNGYVQFLHSVPRISDTVFATQ